MTENIEKALEFLNLHHQAYFDAQPYADKTEHPTPDDSRAWSQILVSLLSGINGLARKKGADLADGSDVKAANTWGAIDTPRFNGVIKAGTKTICIILSIEGAHSLASEVPKLGDLMNEQGRSHKNDGEVR